MARLTAARVREIIAAEGSHREVAARFGTNAMTVSRIRRGTSYQGVDRTTPPPNSYTVADALEYLRAFPAGLVAGVVSSPPYNKGGRGSRMGGRGTNWRAAYRPGGLGQGYAAHADNLPWPEYVAWQRAVLAECLRIVGPAGLVCWNYKPWTRQGQLVDLREDVLAGFPLRQEVIWARNGSNNMERAFLPPTYEKIYLLAGRQWKTPLVVYGESRQWGAVWSIAANADPEHPASFPLALAVRMVRLCGGPVLDPFAGTGTVGLAALDCGFEYYLNDNALEYKEVFEERRRRKGEQPRLETAAA